MLTSQMLVSIMPALPLKKAEKYLPLLIAGMREFGIDNELRATAYLAQLAEESQQLNHWQENLNYSAQRLCQVWSKRFPTLSSAAPYAHNPEKLAEKVYGFRADLGNHLRGDGWKFHGRMPIQATGRSMYEMLTDLLGIDLVSNPDACLDPRLAFRASAAIFARIKNCNSLADGLIHSPNNFKIITKRINGGYTGLESRLEFYKRARRVLPDNLQISGEQIVYSSNHLRDLSDDEINDVAESISVSGQGGASPAVIPPISVASPETFANITPENSAENSADSQPDIKDAPPGNPGTEFTGDAPEAEPRWHLQMEDLKPFCQKWLLRIWKSFGGSNATWQSICGCGVKFGGEYWWIFVLAGVVFFFFSLFIAVTASIVIGIILWKNRGELERAKTFVAESIRNPNLYNVGETVVKKGLKK